MEAEFCSSTNPADDDPRLFLRQLKPNKWTPKSETLLFGHFCAVCWFFDPPCQNNLFSIEFTPQRRRFSSSSLGIRSCKTAEPSKKAGQKLSLLLGGCSCWWRNSFYFGEGTSSSGHYRYYFQKQDLGRCITNSGARSTIARSRFLSLIWENSRNVYQP